MARDSHTIQVVILDSHQEPAYAELEGATIGARTVHVADHIEEIDIEGIRERQPDIVLIDGDAPSLSDLSLVSAIGAAGLPVACIVVWESQDTERIRQAMRMGAEDFQVRPLSANMLLSSMRDTYKVVSEKHPGGWTAGDEEQPPTGSGGVCQAIAITSGTSGAGKSVIGTNLGVATAQHAGRPTALVDLQYGDSAVCLSMKPQVGLAEVAEDPAELGEALHEFIRMEHTSGLHLYPWFIHPDYCQTPVLNAAMVQQCLQVLAGEYAFLYVIMPSWHTADTTQLLTIMDQIVCMLSVHDLLSLRNTRLFLDAVCTDDEQRGKTSVVVNRYSRHTPFEVTDIQKALNHDVTAVLPNDHALAMGSVNSGEPFVSHSPRAELAHSVTQLAAELTGIEITVQPQRKNVLFGQR